jgi:hypothetical protein
MQKVWVVGRAMLAIGGVLATFFGCAGNGIDDESRQSFYLVLNSFFCAAC